MNDRSPSWRAGSGAARLALFTSGDASSTTTPVLFLHAGVCDSRMWAREMEVLGATRLVAAFDRRGYGATDATDERYDDVADTVAVLDALGLRRAVLVGCSNGGRIALDTALAHPDRVDGLVLVCAAVGGAPEDGAIWQDEPLRTLHARWLEAGEAGDRSALVRLAAQVWLDGPLELEGRVGGDVRALFLDMIEGTPVEAEDDPNATVRNDAYARLPNLRTPTLIVCGPLDVSDVTKTMRHAAATIPDAQALEVPGTAHLPNLERPDVFIPALERFIDKVDAAGA